MNCKSMLLAAAIVFAAAGSPALAQDQQASSPDQSAPPFAVPAGTRLLIGLEEKLCTKDDKSGKSFQAQTLEPVVAPDGRVIPVGTRIRGHIDKIEAAGKAGRARMWLAFDQIEISGSPRPLVANLIDAPGIHSIRVAYDHEGEIEVSTSKRDREAQAAAAAALVGAAPGIVSRNGKDAAMGAAVGAVTAFLIESGLGQDLTLEKNTKLELVLLRPLYLKRG
jgi:hypothetical protein